MSLRSLIDRKGIRIIAPLALLAGAAVFAIAVSAADDPTAPQKIQGVLIDKECSVKMESRVLPGNIMGGGIVEAYTHTRECALMAECQRSGYAIMTHDSRYLIFDAAGNQKALAALKGSKKADDLQVEVEGQVQGNTMKVTSLSFL